MKSLKNQVYPVWNQVRNQVLDQVRYQVTDQVRNQVRRVKISP